MVKTKRPQRTAWLVPAFLILLSTVPVAAGAARLVELSSNVEVTAANTRFFASPTPVMLHIISVTLYSVLGALQFSSHLRRRHPALHKALGRVLIPAGFLAALSGLWMTQFYPWPPGDGMALYALRLIFGSAMLLSIVAGVIALNRRDYNTHGDWMTRAYAIGLGAGTQVFTHLPWVLFLGQPDELTRAVLMGAGWVINILIAEWVINRRRSKRARPIAASA